MDRDRTARGWSQTRDWIWTGTFDLHLYLYFDPLEAGPDLTPPLIRIWIRTASFEHKPGP